MIRNRMSSTAPAKAQAAIGRDADRGKRDHRDEDGQRDERPQGSQRPFRGKGGDVADLPAGLRRARRSGRFDWRASVALPTLSINRPLNRSR